MYSLPISTLLASLHAEIFQFWGFHQKKQNFAAFVYSASALSPISNLSILFVKSVLLFFSCFLASTASPRKVRNSVLLADPAILFAFFQIFYYPCPRSVCFLSALRPLCCYLPAFSDSLPATLTLSYHIVPITFSIVLCKSIISLF